MERGIGHQLSRVVRNSDLGHAIKKIVGIDMILDPKMEFLGKKSLGNLAPALQLRAPPHGQTRYGAP